ncbi:hypothetical protein LSH36_1941g00038 [Paralvinella palmiformis]|uniref:Uncharacterized protein n=1 Tax=Paralvinella palmiformis TaxID=53620 RepID=A0AAD9MP68_9ANNE|nr:hypothetical protein LSH36_1941g00038 [Paralvinella palmiformis]
MPLFGNKEVPKAVVLEQQENLRKSDFLVDEENMASVITMFIMYTLMTTTTAGYWRMNNFTVEVVTSDNRTTQSCGEYREADPVIRGGSYTFKCNSKQGRYVYARRLQGSRQHNYMTLCEVVIDGFIMITSSFTRTPTTTTTTPSITTSTTTSTLSTSKTIRTPTSPTTTRTNTTATLYSFARKQLSQPSNHSDNSTHGHTTLSYINNSSDVGIENQQPMNTQNIDSNGYEDVNIRNIHLTERQREDMITEETPQYERLQGQVNVNDRGNICTSLVMAKVKVAPSKPVTVLRLELSDGVLSVKIGNYLARELTYDDIRQMF